MPTYLLEELWCNNLNECFLIDNFEVSKQRIEAARRVSAYHMLISYVHESIQCTAEEAYHRHITPLLFYIHLLTVHQATM